MLPETSILIHFLLRWLHFIFGVMWIGHLYFFNFVNANFQATLDAATKQKVVPELMPRALFFFRWAAMVTFITGYAMIIYRYFLQADGGGFEALFASSYGHWIAFGGLLGTVMWFNVWFIIWPNQKKVILAVKAGEKPDGNAVERARKASKLNTYLSAPMLFGMGAASHLPSLNGVLVVAALVLGFGLIWHLYKEAPKVGKLD